MYEVLICDLDGTLVDLGIDWDRLREKVRRLLKTTHPLKPLAPSIPKAANYNPQLIREAFRVVEEVELKAANNARENSELLRLLSKLKRKRVRFCIVTLQSKTSAKKVVSKMRLQEHLDLLVTRDDSLDRLEQLEIALSTLGISKASRAVFIGDTDLDLKAGLQLGLKTIIIGREFRDVTDAIRSLWGDLS